MYIYTYIYKHIYNIIMCIYLYNDIYKNTCKLLELLCAAILSCGTSCLLNFLGPPPHWHWQVKGSQDHSQLLPASCTNDARRH